VAAESRGIPLRAILTTVAVVVLTYLAGKLIYRLREVVLILLMASFLAVLLNPLVIALQRWRIKRRGWAVTVVTFWALVVFFGLAVAFGLPLSRGVTHLANNLPGYVSAAEHGRGWLGHLVRKYHVTQWVNHNVPKLVNIGQGLAKPALSLGKGALTLLVTLFTIFVFMLLLLLEGPKMRAALLGALAPERAERWSRIAREVNHSVTGYMLGNVLTSIIAGIVVFVTLLVLGVPFPFLWALWVAVVDFLPQIGGALAGIPTVLFALAHSLTAGIVTLVVFITYQQIENHVLNPVIMSKTVSVNPLLILVAILVGVSIGDWLGGTFGAFVAALISIPAAGAIQVVVLELWRVTEPVTAVDTTAQPGPPSVTTAPAPADTAAPAAPGAAGSATPQGQAGPGEG
jgi:predicted PurR-regulated permease PerM